MRGSHLTRDEVIKALGEVDDTIVADRQYEPDGGKADRSSNLD
jgi:hypothetical protein